MNRFRVLTVFVTATLFFLTFCTKPDPFGNGLFDDQSDLKYDESQLLTASIVLEDTVVTANLTSGTMLCGLLNDPVFGKTEAVINTLFRQGKSYFNFGTTPVCDSVRMYLAYDIANFYGDTMAMQTMEIWRIKDSITVDSAYLSTSAVELTEKIGEYSFFARPNTRRKLRDTSGVTSQTDSIGTYVTIPLDAAFGQQILNLDSASLSTSFEFGKKMRGLQFRVTTPGGSTEMMSFNLNRLLSRITLFYHTTGKVPTQTYHLFFTGVNKWANIKHDYAGSPVGNLIDKPADSVLFIQSSAGLKVKFELPNIRNLTNVVINQAELEISLLDFPGDNLLFFPPAKQLLLSYSTVTDKYPFIQDVFASAGSGLTGSLVGFGGALRNETSGKKYRLNMSDHIQDMILGKRPTTFYLNIFPQDYSAARSILVGPNSASTFRAKLRLKTSKI